MYMYLPLVPAGVLTADPRNSNGVTIVSDGGEPGHGRCGTMSSFNLPRGMSTSLQKRYVDYTYTTIHQRERDYRFSLASEQHLAINAAYQEGAAEQPTTYHSWT